jgi:hypothetical protein
MVQVCHLKIRKTEEDNNIIYFIKMGYEELNLLGLGKDIFEGRGLLLAV